MSGSSAAGLVPSTPQARRKRGLSLRSQLFTKAVRQQEQNLLPVELSTIDTVKNGPNPALTASETLPEIVVDSLATVEAIPATKTYGLSANFSRSTTHLTSISSHIEDAVLGKRVRVPHGKLSAAIFRARRRLFGYRGLKNGHRGRRIPLSVCKESINSHFLADFYDDYHRGLINEQLGDVYCANTITSSKYTIYSFLPKQLRAQFSKVANCYFMVVAIMQMIPNWSTTGHYTTIIPLLIFMAISIAREGFDDWRRHLHDKEENSKKTIVLRENDDTNALDTHSIATIMTETMQVGGLRLPSPDLEGITGGFGQNSDFLDPNSTFPGKKSDYSTAAMERYNLKEYSTRWKDVQVGDIVKIRENEWFPADVVVIATDSEDNEAFVETMALDGETNLKSRVPHEEIAKKLLLAAGLKSLRTLVAVEDPNVDLYNFEGHFSVDGVRHALGPENVAYRGSILRNTTAVFGLVVFTGEETKIRMNNLKNPRTKSPKLQKNINYIVLFMVFVVISLLAFSTMAERLLYNTHLQRAWYLYSQDAGVAATLMGFIIMYNTLIPLSLYVTMEIIKVMQLLFLQFDIDMYHVETNTPADAKTATILEELGQVSYIFSDKTGTLTDNRMLFRKFSIGGSSWSHDEDGPVSATPVVPGLPVSVSQALAPGLPVLERFPSTKARESIESDRSAPGKNVLSSRELLQYVQTHPQTLFSKKASFFLLTIALCNTCVPRKRDLRRSFSASSLSLEESDEIVYQGASPDELALVQAARDLGFVVYDRTNRLLTVKTYPEGLSNEPKTEVYEVLETVDFTLARKRMSVVVKFPDGRICLICKGADNVILERLRLATMARQKAREIALKSADRRTTEADVVLQRLSTEAESRKSGSSFRSSFSDAAVRMSIDGVLAADKEVADVSERARNSLHLQQKKKYNIDPSQTIPSDKTVLNDEYVIEKTLEHVEEFSSEGLRTLLYGFRWVDRAQYEEWGAQYAAAKTALEDRSQQIELIGGQIEHSLELGGATAIEDKLQEGVSEAIDKLRRAGIKLWMLTGDKRETAINIGYACRLIKDYSTVVILTNDEDRTTIMLRITAASMEIKAGSVAHCVLVIDGATLADIEKDQPLFLLFVELCVQVDLTVCCRASPAQKAAMVSAVRKLQKKAVTLAIGDGANDIAMLQSADIGVGITGKEGLQAARSADYAVAQFRFILKLLLVHGRYNYVRTSKFVLCTFYKELLFYLTQAVYQRYTLFLGLSLYESWLLLMFNTLFTLLAVLCVGMFDKDLQPATLLAVPELYSKGRTYQAFNLRVFVGWMILAALQSLGMSFILYYVWGFLALKDNDVFPLGTLLFATLTVVINAKCEILEMQNRQWVAAAAFIISVGGYALWNVLIMVLYRSKESPIFFVSYGLVAFGPDTSWWAALLALITVPLLFDVLIKVFKFMVAPLDDDLFKLYEKDIDMRRLFEKHSLSELHQGWEFPREPSSWRKTIIRAGKSVNKKLGWMDEDTLTRMLEIETPSAYRKRAGTDPLPGEMEPNSGGTATYIGDFEAAELEGYEILPSGVKVKRKKKGGIWAKMGRRLQRKNVEDNTDVDAIIETRLEDLRREEGVH